MYRVIFLLLLFIFACSCSGGDLAVIPDKIRYVSFQNESTLWIITREKSLFRVSDDGAIQEVDLFTGNAELVFFLNENKGWVYTKGGHIWSTVDGENWERIGKDSTSVEMTGAFQLVFTDELNGWVMGTYGLAKTNNGGISWKEITPPASQTQNLSNTTGFYPKDSQSGWLVFVEQGLAYTGDDGNNWSVSQFGAKERDVNSISCFKDTICLIGTGGDGLYSFPYDNTKEPMSIGGDLRAYMISSISFSDENNIWWSGFKFIHNTNDQVSGIIMRSDDAGKTWVKIEPPKVKDKYNHVRFFDLEVGWLVSPNSIYKTTNGGKMWNEIVTLN